MQNCLEYLKTLGYECNMGMLKRSTIFNMVKENRMKIKHGDVEGFVIMTDLDVFTGYLKWKGAHYKQLILEREIRDVNESMENNENYQDDIKIMYKWIVEIFDCERKNQYYEEIKKVK